MGLLSALVGGSHTKSESTQTQDSSGLQLTNNNASSNSGSVSTGVSGGVTGSQGTTGSEQSVFSGDLVRQLYSGALGAAGAIDPALATSRVNQLFTGGASILDQLEGGGAGTDYLNKRLSGDNSSVLNAQIDALGSDLGRFYKEQLNPTIVGNSISAGQLGGGREGVAQGAASDSVLRQFATQAGNLRAADITSRDNAAISLLQTQGANAKVGLDSLSSLATLGSGASVLDPYKAAGQVFGAPTALTSSYGQNTSFGQEFSQQQAEQYATSISQELGISIDEAHALLKSTQKGSSSNGILPAISGFVPKG
jgi:hypothetical protein